MELLNNYRNITTNISEEEMQNQVDIFLKKQVFRKWDGYHYKELPKIVLREFSIPEIGRRSDHILVINNKRIVNIECKLKNINKVIKQAKDHLEWCDYSVIIMPPDLGYLANHHITECIKNKIGLWYWFDHLGVFEFILPAFNSKKNHQLRQQILGRILVKDVLNKARMQNGRNTH